MNSEDFFEQPGNIDIIKCTDHINFTTILDVGFGKGGASLFLQKKERKSHLLVKISLDSDTLEMSLKNMKLMSMIVQ